MRHAHLLFFTDKNVVDHLQQNMWSVRQLKKKSTIQQQGGGKRKQGSTNLSDDEPN